MLFLFSDRYSSIRNTKGKKAIKSYLVTEAHLQVTGDAADSPRSNRNPSYGENTSIFQFSAFPRNYPIVTLLLPSRNEAKRKRLREPGRDRVEPGFGTITDLVDKRFEIVSTWVSLPLVCPGIVRADSRHNVLNAIFLAERSNVTFASRGRTFPF